MIYEWSATQFSLTFSESTGAVSTEDSLCHRWQQFQGLFVTGRQLSFPWLFMSQQRLCALTNPLVTSGNIFGDDFWEGSDSVFLYCFWVNRCCASWGFLLSSLETVFVTISKWSVTQFSLTFSESTGAVRAEDSFCHLWKQFTWLFLIGQRLSFPWHFLSQQVLCTLRIPSIISGNSFVTISEWSATQFSLTFSESTGVVRAEDSFCHLCKQFPWWFLSGQWLSFPWHFLSQQVLCALRIPSVISGNSFRDDISVVSDSVFLDIFWVNRCCARWGFLLSSL
jgi:hypothetical protein